MVMVVVTMMTMMMMMMMISVERGIAARQAASRVEGVKLSKKKKKKKKTTSREVNGRKYKPTFHDGVIF